MSDIVKPETISPIPSKFENSATPLSKIIAVDNGPKVVPNQHLAYESPKAASVPQRYAVTPNAIPVAQKFVASPTIPQRIFVSGASVLPAHVAIQHHAGLAVSALPNAVIQNALPPGVAAVTPNRIDAPPKTTVLNRTAAGHYE